MKILVVCTSSRVFGAETMSLNLLHGLKGRGFELLAVTTVWTDGEFSRRLAKLGVGDVVLPLGTFAKPVSGRGILWSADMLWRLPQLWRGFARTCRQFRPDLVVFTNPKHALLLYPWLGRQPSVLLEHSQCATNRANRWLFQTLAGKLTRFVSTSEFMVGHLRELGIAEGQICVIKIGSVLRGVPENFSQLRALASNPADGFRIGIAGQVSAHKGHDCLLEATQRLKAAGKQFVVQVYGDGDPNYVAGLKQRVVAAGLAAEWRWLGYEPDVAKVYGNMDLCVVPSCFDEPFGMVAVEAAAYGLPVVASRRGGLAEIVADGVSGWLVESGDPVSLAEKLSWCLDHPEQARDLGRAARARALEQFSIEQTAEKFSDLFRELSQPSVSR